MVRTRILGLPLFTLVRVRRLGTPAAYIAVTGVQWTWELDLLPGVAVWER